MPPCNGALVRRKKTVAGTGTVSVFGYQVRFDLRKGFPSINNKESAVSTCSK
ncbi:thymidylate synthase [Bacillus pacificus]